MNKQGQLAAADRIELLEKEEISFQEGPDAHDGPHDFPRGCREPKQQVERAGNGCLRATNAQEEVDPPMTIRTSGSGFDHGLGVALEAMTRADGIPYSLDFVQDLRSCRPSVGKFKTDTPVRRAAQVSNFTVFSPAATFGRTVTLSPRGECQPGVEAVLQIGNRSLLG